MPLKKYIPPHIKQTLGKEAELPKVEEDLRKVALSVEHNIPVKDIYIDPIHGGVLYRNPATDGWLTSPKLRGW